MANKDKFNFVSDGHNLSGSDVTELHSFPLSIALNLVLDGFATTSQKRLYSDLFNSDSAGTVNMTYDTGSNLYSCNTGTGTETCVLTTSAFNVPLGFENDALICSSALTTASTTTLIVEGSMDSGSTWTTMSERVITEGFTTGNDIMFRYTFNRTNTSSVDSISGVAAYYG